MTEYTPAEITVLTENWLKQELAVSDDSETRIQVIPLDNRIGNKICQQQLQLSMPQGSSQRQSTVQISCPDELSWQLYIQVRISQIILATTLRQNIITGSRLTADTLQQEPRELRFIRGTPVTEPEQVIGARAKRAMSMGQIITLQDLCLVCRGDVVTITVDDNGLSVSATGIAQQDGTLGDTISVVNRQSNRTIKAEVTAVNTVKVKF
ncbi:flagellar basal body P-ring formation chaperone FlgA [Chromatiaceae bacterium AAb-1]|nr:flagellar basal body P-ring formation chaperone FlgA [Chromatiaceae bacterium AAb-1]